MRMFGRESPVKRFPTLGTGPVVQYPERSGVFARPGRPGDTLLIEETPQG